jgi:hypothetical protein
MRGLPRWSMLHLAQAIMIACESFALYGPARRRGFAPLPLAAGSYGVKRHPTSGEVAG